MTQRSPLPGLAGPRAEKAISLALQGGGAHGAFTWGVLDAILEDGRLAIEAISGASAGAMNAVVLAEGWRQGGAEGARRCLADFWRSISLDGDLPAYKARVVRQALGLWTDERSPLRFWMEAFSPFTTPYQNVLDVNPLRDALEALISFSDVRACDEAKLFVSATNVWSGKVRVFERRELTVDHLLASACLPELYKAVEIEGEPYWDGGYMGNPPLFPLFYGVDTNDVLLVQINPIERRETPRTRAEIRDRLNEITFNAPLLRELRAVDFVTRLLDEGKLAEGDYKRVLMHRIEPTGHFDDFPASTRKTADFRMMKTLFERGRGAAQDWLARHYDDIGIRPTIELKRDYS
ncbi:patatin-like phospholipase family protein [Salinarimonas ramus]|uniref:Alpha/beta hydrolase n=1 Tax=Salinarimonas ramus TaxID=690164 RepID=A0A917V5G8_9HYPH|nr:patatin-like phospholipase family protein [Salinarimonas ramus]GGK39441.1 alpha/beta hydrolase [Salinarimonas ramus]